MLKERCETVSELIQDAYGFDIPWTLIQQLVDWMIANCFNREASFRSAAANPTGFQMWRLHRKAVQSLRREGYRGRKLNQAANATVDAVLAAGSDASNSDLDTMYGECV